MAYQRGGIIVFLSCMWFHCSYSTPLAVPLLTWNNIDSKYGTPTVTAGKTKYLSDEYKKHIEPLMKSKPLVLIFLQDELSADDFTKFASSFSHLQKILSTKRYLLLPSVLKEKESLSELIGGSANEIEYVDSSSLATWKYKGPPSDDTVNKVIVFHLEPVSGSHTEGKGEILKSNDLVMHRIIKLLKEQVKDFSVVYSAEDASTMISKILLDENIEESNLVSRHLLGSSDNVTETFFNNTCVMMYVNSIRHTLHKNTTEFIKPWKQKWKLGGCGSHNLGCSISLTREGSFGIYANITLLIEFKNDTQEWYCDLLRFSGKRDGVSFASTFECGSSNSSTGFDSATYNTIIAPIRMSFACQDLTFTTDNGTNIVVLGGIQIQTVCDGRGAKKQFSSAYHCVGFFTIEILTGIFVTIILLIGLYVGIMMILAIQVQDRFDDPKGKTINVVQFQNE